MDSVKNHVVVERRSEQIGVQRMNSLQKGLAHGFWNSRSQVFRRNVLQNALPTFWLGPRGSPLCRVISAAGRKSNVPKCDSVNGRKDLYNCWSQKTRTAPVLAAKSSAPHGSGQRENANYELGSIDL